ncbi:hypothetical protein QN277_020048 [Acacia crassicarpa]|uniref:Uncharacterized protein n=1 Tax=Acacia crassicarpa TaxID=499986 RepID=A0AAE1MKN5_9FABA|nr:hypothetical protein QN277_020048 [Acacia crassicarpa]
MKTFAECVR